MGELGGHELHAEARVPWVAHSPLRPAEVAATSLRTEALAMPPATWPPSSLEKSSTIHLPVNLSAYAVLSCLATRYLS